MKRTLFLTLLISMVNFYCSIDQINFAEKNIELLYEIEKKFNLKNQFNSGENVQQKDVKHLDINYYFLFDKETGNSIKVNFSDDKDKIQEHYARAKSSIAIGYQTIPYQKHIKSKGVFDEYVFFDCEEGGRGDECNVSFIGYHQNYVFKIYGEKLFFDESFMMICEKLQQMYK